MLSLFKDARFERAMAPQGAGQSDVDGLAIDVGTGRVATFIAYFGTVAANAVTSIKVQQSTTATGPFADLADSKVDVAPDDDNKLAIIEIENPTKRYVRMVLERGTSNATLHSALAIVTRVKRRAAIQKANETVSGSKTLSSPAEGTA